MVRRKHHGLHARLAPTARKVEHHRAVARHEDGARRRVGTFLLDRFFRADFGRAARPGPTGDEELFHAPRKFEEHRIDGDREDRRAHDEVHHAVVGETERHGFARENEGEFADLRQGRADGERGLQGTLQKEHDPEGGEALAEHHDEERDEDLSGRFDEDVPVKEHPDAHEEEDREGVLKRNRFGGRAMRKAALAHHHAGEEGAEREAHVENRRRGVGDAQSGRQHEEREEFSRTGLGHLIEKPRHRAAPDDEHHRDEGGDVHERHENVLHQLVAARRFASRRSEKSRERRKKNEDENGRDVFYDEPSHGDAAVPVGELPAHFERLDEHHGRGAGERQTEDDPRAPAPIP